MRVKELLHENYTDAMANDLMDLLTFAKGAGKSQVDTDTIVRTMDQMGYSVTPESVVELLSGNPVVTNATPESIHLAAENPSSSSDATDNSAEKVAGMAANAIKKG